MSIIGILAAMAGIAIIYFSWSILKFIFTFFVKVFVFIGMASFVILLFLIFIGTTMTWLADAKQQQEIRLNNQTTSPSAKKRDSAYGIPVPNKPGYIFSPYISGKINDVRGLLPDIVVEDPYTGKLIIVP